MEWNGLAFSVTLAHPYRTYGLMHKEILVLSLMFAILRLSHDYPVVSGGGNWGKTAA